jgi:S-adenosylmethionine:tRNA-ribosyltransferase-isomerase (queuine synthetase)
VKSSTSEGRAFGVVPEGLKPKVILVWDKHQVVPATLFGENKYGKGGFDVLVCQNPDTQLKELGVERASIYHF